MNLIDGICLNPEYCLNLNSKDNIDNTLKYALRWGSEKQINIHENFIANWGQNVKVRWGQLGIIFYTTLFSLVYYIFEIKCQQI